MTEDVKLTRHRPQRKVETVLGIHAVASTGMTRLLRLVTGPWWDQVRYGYPLTL